MGIGRVLVIAGSDSSGGAGIEADQKVIAAHGCYAMTATTALTAQNTQGVEDIHYVPAEFVGKLIDVSIGDVGVDVVKTGMLASGETVQVVAKALQRHHVKSLIVDPVIVSTSGSQLLPSTAIRELRELLLPYTTVLTPNVPEAKLLLSDAGKVVDEPKNLNDLMNIAKQVQSLGPKYVLVKGGHLPLKNDKTVATTEEERELMVDILYGEGVITEIWSRYQKSRNTHGTGCSMASAIASNIANGMPVVQAVRSACRYIEAGIRTAPNLGKGNGPINHFHSNYSLPFAPGRFVEYLLERPDVKGAWRDHTEHAFVAGLGDGTLPMESFKYYLIQDYLYLVQFARATALASYKAKTMEGIAASAGIVLHIHREMALHINYCEGLGMTKAEIEACEESQACTAYTRYVLDIGQSEDWLALQISMAPCLIGYGEIAKRLHADPKTKREGNIYWKWIENYVADDYTEAVNVGSALLEKHAVLQSPNRIEELVKIFVHATKMETGFWDMGSGGKV
ncbi:phosphomethylpyrimidine kinase [Sclerotinia borealis F-4128]|uniref:Phosphomethylpyrimidine kinase n=1 Tax=Sclerotinia borealis (strain F-4128) TaxID=1432307 RepID=W9CRA9_SCLBF|nr:phosphomethylpyrimidine kinase [Sclerotinia borealis F-4128]